MAVYVTSGKAHNILLEFKVDGLPVTPTAIHYWLYDNANNIVASLSNVAVSPTGETSIISLSNSANLRTKTIEYRKLYVEFIYSGLTYIVNKHYFLRDNTFFPLSADDVRAVMGVGFSDLPDEVIDILRAYDEVKVDASGIDLDAIITNGTANMEYVLKAVAYKTASNSVITLNSNVFKMEQADNTLYQRFDNFNYSSLSKDMSSGYSKYIALLKAQTVSALKYSIISVGTDAVTGA